MADSDKLYNRTGSWGDNALGDGDPVTPAYLGGVDTNALMLGRCRWTTGATVLQQPDCEAGALQMQPGDRLLRGFRISGTSTAVDADRLKLSTPYRGDWHYDDNAGPPPLDNRVCKGDSYLADSGSGDRYVAYYDSAEGRFAGYGVLAEYRTAATALADSSSDSVTLRASKWVTGAPKYRDWFFRSVLSTGDSSLNVYRQSEGSSSVQVFQISEGGAVSIRGDASPCAHITFGTQTSSSPGSRFGMLVAEAAEADNSEFVFGHSGSSKLARFRFKSSTDERSGVNALALSAIYGSAATGGTTTVKSASSGWVASYWDGAAAQEAVAYAQLILTSTDPAGYIRRGFDYDVGTFDHYSDGACLVGIDFDGASAYGGSFAIRATTATTPSSPSRDAPFFSSIARSGIADVNRMIAWHTQVDSSADASDLWSYRMVAVGSGGPTDMLGIRHTGEILPADAGGHVFELSAALGTHAKTTASDKTGNAKLGTFKVKLDSGATAHIQLYAD